ncbi:MAG: hydrogenase maturation nickel metallochaperone HypA [Armatimonadetes bacterium]|nr:hydrogenase maturation nickel metallochaperone HypA [Armatimonadota bacterium]
MHEAHLAQDLVEVAVAEAEKQGAKRIRRVRFRVGRKYQVVPEALEIGFRMAAEGTIAAGATLDVEQVPLAGKCRRCGARAESDEPILVCEACGGTDVAVLQGNEMVLASLDVE